MTTAPNDPNTTYGAFLVGSKPGETWVITRACDEHKRAPHYVGVPFKRPLGDIHPCRLGCVYELVPAPSEPTRTEASECAHLGAFDLPGANWMKKCPECHATLNADQIEIARLRSARRFDETRLKFRQDTIDNLYAALNKAEAELLRLAGPICEHDGKRASEHWLSDIAQGVAIGDGSSVHPDWPDGDKWLRENAR